MFVGDVPGKESVVLRAIAMSMDGLYFIKAQESSCVISNKNDRRIAPPFLFQAYADGSWGVKIVEKRCL